MIKLKKEKGQAFSTFQLLIAAVVALALLAVLLPLLKTPSPDSNVTKLTKDLLKAQQTNIGTLSYTQKAKIQPKYKMSISGVTQNTGVDTDQVAIVVPSGLNTSFDVTNNKVLSYKKSSKGTYIFGVFCDYKEKFDDSLKNNNLDNLNVSASDLFSDKSTDGLIVCVIFPERTS